MKKELLCVTTGVIAGWMMFTEKGQNAAKDICTYALDAACKGDEKLSQILFGAITEKPALEEHHDAAAVYYSNGHHTHTQVPHNPGHHEIHAVEVEAHEGPVHTALADAATDETKKVEEMEHAVSRT